MFGFNFTDQVYKKLYIVLAFVFVTAQSSLPSNQQFTSNKQSTWMGSDYELVHLLRCFVHIFPISQVDSHNPQVIQAASLASASMTMIALVHALGRNVENTYPIKEICIAGPKVAGCLLAIAYDLIRYYDAQKLALKNFSTSEKARYRSFKIQQYLRLIFESGLRIITYLNVRSGDTGFSSVSLMADFLEIWRLLDRYETYFGISGYELQFNLVMKAAQENPNALIVNSKEELQKLQEALSKDKELEKELREEYITTELSSNMQKAIIQD